MAFSLSGKHILVTGSTDGLGKLLAKDLISQGAVVTIHGRNEEKVKQTKEELQAQEGIVCDLQNAEEITKVFSSIEKLDTLVNNAGVWLEGDTVDARPERISELAKVNFLAPLLVTSTLLPKLLQSDFAQILNVVSIAGVEIPAGYYHTIYSAVKFGMQGFTEALAKEFYNKNLRVMGIYPAGMETPLFKKAGNDYKEHEPWMFHPQESVDAIIFMLTRDKKINVKRMDIINQLEI